MKKIILIALVSVLMLTNGYSQTDKLWKSVENRNIITSKNVTRLSFPKEYDLYELNIAPLREVLFTAINNTSKKGVIINLPNTKGTLEQFEMFEASNFDSELQARFPEIRAFSGRGITDRYATIKLSISPQGIQTMVFRTEKENEFMEPYSQDGKIYAVFNSQREKGKLAWSCSTDDKTLMSDVNKQLPTTNKSSAGQLKTMRLAQSCNGEYAAFFGASTAGTPADEVLVLSAFNATLTRCNGVYEKDLALHLNLVASSTNIIYYNPATDPYSTTLANWNTELQKAINTTLTGPSTTLAANNAAYDIGHMFGASGGGGNAGCIGCVCVNGTSAGSGATKGRGITSPADGVPMGDKFDIDYVAHEIGHQLGGNHTFSNTNEGSGVSKEVGSGVTIMGYAGITAQDIALNSIDIFHETSIAQIQANLATKSCPVTSSLAGINATPVANAGLDYTIPKSTPFILTGVGTDADAGDALTYCWEQNDDGGTSTGVNSNAIVTKVIGPNWRSWKPTATPIRYMPILATVKANLQTTAGTGDPGFKAEALSSVARTLNFRLTVRDNVPYSASGPATIAQTNFDDMVVTVTDTAGPFLVTVPNTNVTWAVGSNTNITWDEAGTNSNGINAANVDIFLSTDGGNTYPITLATGVPNDGVETVVVPNNIGTTNRVMVKGASHIFYDISNTNFTIAAPTTTFDISTTQPTQTFNCTGSVVYTIDYQALGGYTGTATFSTTGEPAGATVVFSPTSMSSTGSFTVTVSNIDTSPAGSYSITLTATDGTITKTLPLTLKLYSSTSPPMSLTSPADNATGIAASVNLVWASNINATSYDVQVATDIAFTAIISSGNVATTSYTVSGLIQNTDYYWRVSPKNSCNSVNYSAPFKFKTAIIVCNNFPSTDPALPLAIPDNVPVGATSTFNIPAGMGNITDLNVALRITHTFIGDLTGTLKSPTGTTITLFAQPCIDDYHGPLDVTFDDAGIVGACAPTPGGLSGTILPTQALSAFNGQDPTGMWTLFVVDAGPADVGNIESWSLNICSATLAVAQNTLTNFTLYPNPNKGNFTVQFDSKTNSDIAISVYDMRGRIIMNNKYSNTGLFSQSINLDKVQAGIYMVTVQDGDTKVVKRIIVE